MSRKDAIVEVARTAGVPKREVYERWCTEP